MNKILSQDEVNALLSSINSPTEGATQGDALASSSDSSSKQSSDGVTLVKTAGYTQYGMNKKVAIYNFRRPDRVPKTLLRSLQFLHDKFCSNVSSSLSAYLRAITEVTLLSVEQTTYAEFLVSLSDPTYYSAISISPLDGMAALEMNLELVFPIIDRLLGGVGSVLKLNRNITEIEKNIIQGVIKLITTNLAETWKPVSVIEFAFRASETRPQLLHVAAANEVVILVIFEVKVGDTRGTMHLCLPFAGLEPISGKFEQEINVRGRGNVKEENKRLLSTLFKMPVSISAELAGGMVTVRDLLILQPCDVLKLDRIPSDHVMVHIGGIPRFSSTGVIWKDHKAVKILPGNDAAI
ncbi:MAG TPA: flagellar motor switch protein FliM [Terriglobia bacterium]|nr:flagellar motor switch protein FliM [Terriglobia bacterium]